MGKNTRLLGSVALAMLLSMGGAAFAQDIDFGDDTSAWANDGQCDDPRFEGTGSATFSVSADEMRDATDCEAAFAAGTVTVVGEDATPEPSAPPATTPPVSAEGAIDFGDDSSTWANDGECDDGRFAGEAMGLTNMDHVRMDATDCRTAFDAGTVTYVGEAGTTPEPVPAPAVNVVGMVDGIDFGDDSSTWANDGECDDGRFEGEAMGLTSMNHVRMDGTDCLTAYNAGTVTYAGENGPGGDMGDLGEVAVNFGDDTGVWANDGECDDPRFEGTGMGVADEGHRMTDATDCRTAYTAGTITLVGEGGDSGEPIINFGDDSSAMAFDGVCDDPRFQGSGGASLLYAINSLADATDCRAAYDAGTVTLAP